MIRSSIVLSLVFYISQTGQYRPSKQTSSCPELQRFMASVGSWACRTFRIARRGLGASTSGEGNSYSLVGTAAEVGRSLWEFRFEVVDHHFHFLGIPVVE